MQSGMGQISDEYESPNGPAPSEELPSRLRLLCLSPTEPSWINLTLQLDREGCHEPQFRWLPDTAAALSILRDESFDCIVIGDGPSSRETSFSPRDAVEFLRALRASGCDDSAVFMASELDDETWLQLSAAECSVLITPRTWESRALVAAIKRELVRVELIRENHRLAIEQNRRLVRERDEAEHLLDQQRRMIHDLGNLIANSNTTSTELLLDDSGNSNSSLHEQVELPTEVKGFYTELLRTYVIMGSGSLGREIAQLAELISMAGLSTREALKLHIERVEALVQGLGNRSSRHVMARADLLALELMIHLGDCYQRAAR
jgi:hypothetical protein